jgi:signal transduction histidine kinase
MSEQPRWLRPALAGAVLAATLLTLTIGNCWCDVDHWLGRLVLVLVVDLVWAVELTGYRLPRPLFAAAVALPIGWLIVTDNAGVGGLFLLLMVGWVVYTGSLRAGMLAVVLSSLSVLGYVHFDSPDRWLPWIVGMAATGVMIRLALGQQQLVQQLRAAQADLAHQAAVEERRRIAREIHDVAAHSLAVTLLHLTGARMRAQREGAQAWLIEALAQAERLGRQSLDDVRRTVGLLQDSAAGTAPPLPGADDIAQLVDEFRAAGLQVVLDVHGVPGEVAPATGLALYRITQEALANVVKHAPGAGADIVLDLGAEARLRVHNPVAERAPSDSPTGMGLGGMRERATLLGGWLRAGPDEAGWLVECAIPR